MINVTEMAKSFSKSISPGQWLKNAYTKELINTLTEMHN